MKKILISCLMALFTISMVAFSTSCGFVDTLKQKMCEHVYDDGVITKNPTCTEKGELTKTCTSCNYTMIEDIPSFGHSVMNVEGRDATCVRSGVTQSVYCVLCEETISGGETIPSLGHDLEAMPYKCSHCTTDIFEYFRNESCYTEVDFKNGDFICGKYYRIYRPSDDPLSCSCGTNGGCFGFHGLEIFNGTPFIGAYSHEELYSESQDDSCFYSPISNKMHEWTWQGDFAIRFYYDYIDIYFGVCSFVSTIDNTVSYEIGLNTCANIAFGSEAVIKELVLNEEI